MSWLITGAEKSPVDPYRSQVSLLLHGDGTNGSTTIVDSSPTPKTVTAVGNAQISTAQSKFGGASIAFDGTGDYLTVPHSSTFSADTDLTVECWIRLAEINRLQFIVDKRSSAISNREWYTYVSANNTLSVVLWNATGSVYLVATSAATLAINTWHHLAFTLAGTSLRLFLDGTLEAASSSPVGSYGTNNNQLTIGRDVSTAPGRDLNGHINDLRITKGVARYTSNFTPPTAPFPDF